MKATITHAKQSYEVDFNSGIDLSLPVSSDGPRAWYVDPVRISPVITRQFTGSVALGGAVNFYNVSFNPHGHGTHTESVGHISPERHPVNDCLKEYFFIAQLLTVQPTLLADASMGEPGDHIITAHQLKPHLINETKALILRTLPNLAEKRTKNYSNTNFPYIHHEAMSLLVSHGIEQLLVDLPSVDREEDGGRLLAHRAFWGYPKNIRANATITEFVYAPDEVPDGLYFLNLQVAPFVNDAAPSRPVVFQLKVKN